MYACAWPILMLRELRGKCKREKRLASAAKAFVADWLSVPPVKLAVRGRDRYGRLLAAVESGRGDLSRALLPGRPGGKIILLKQ